MKIRYILCVALWVANSISIAAQQQAKPIEETIPGTTIKFKMVSVPAGNLLIGTPPDEKVRDSDEGPQQKVTLSAFWMAEHEVTFEEWDAFFKNMDVPQTKAVQVDAVSRPTPQYMDLTWGRAVMQNNLQTV